jgi:hypothetical protein
MKRHGAVGPSPYDHPDERDPATPIGTRTATKLGFQNLFHKFTSRSEAFLSPPLVKEGLGVGDGRYETCLAGVSEARSPPTLALPHKGGGDHKAFCTSVFLLIQRYCPQ